MKNYKPNYKDGSIVNLISSIKKALGGKSEYGPLAGFDITGMAHKNIVLIIIDGLGYEYLTKNGKGSFLAQNLKGEMTSVFPATTAAALTSLFTGVAPQQHALTGWFMYLKEIGAVSAIIRFTTRGGRLPLGKGAIKYEDICSAKSFFEDLKVTSVSIRRKSYINSEYSQMLDKGAKQLPYSSLNGFFRQIKKALDIDPPSPTTQSRGFPLRISFEGLAGGIEATIAKDLLEFGPECFKRKYITAYWDMFDWWCHKEGPGGLGVKSHFEELDRKIKKLAGSLKNTNTTIIVTADHGLVNTKDGIIYLKDHPQLVETLTLPLTGDARAIYCYVKPAKVKQFEKYVRTKLGKYCDMYKSSDLIKKGYFGLFEPNDKLKERVGDYILIMKENYAMVDMVLGEERHVYDGNHGGVSREEMIVPLIVII